MVLYEDDRNKLGKHQNIHGYCDRHGIEIIRKRLKYGDYVLSEDDVISVDTKRNLEEVCTNLTSSDRSRFWTEVRNSHINGVKLIFLVECGGKYRSMRDVAAWKSKRCNVSGRVVMEKMYQVHIAYGVEWVFCDKRSTGKRIVEILTTERDKWLRNEPWR